jgi:orotidine-5'-phosphate decarboxylase
VAVALDTADWRTFEHWCGVFGPRVGTLKVGLEAYVRWGPRAASVAVDTGAEVFLDLKLHDIPNTVAGAVTAARSLGVRYLTVHAAGGRPALEAAVEASAGEIDLLAVTVLTHLDEAVLEELDIGGPAGRRVEGWAELASSAGCAGAVCSPLEVGALRRRIPAPFLLVTPGIRPAGGSTTDDQRRVATPARALADGSDLLVIGRPLTRAADPEAALEALEQELSG